MAAALQWRRTLTAYTRLHQSSCAASQGATLTDWKTEGGMDDCNKLQRGPRVRRPVVRGNELILHTVKGDENETNEAIKANSRERLLQGDKGGGQKEAGIPRCHSKANSQSIKASSSAPP